MRCQVDVCAQVFLAVDNDSDVAYPQCETFTSTYYQLQRRYLDLAQSCEQRVQHLYARAVVDGCAEAGSRVG